MRRATIVPLIALLLVSCGSSDGAADEATTSEASAPAVASTEAPTTDAPTTQAPIATAPPPSAPATTAAATTIAPAEAAAGPGEAPSIRELLDAGTIMNLAHAGGDQAAPHSTMFAFREAVDAGANALEMDVQLTGDGVLIVQHDDTVDKTTNATGPVSALTLDEIQALDNAYWFSPQCWPCQDRPTDEYLYRGIRTGEVPPPDGYTADDFRVETFRDIATAFPDMPLDIEIKGSFPDAIPVAEQLAAEIIELGRVDSVVVVSFDDELVDAFHELVPDVAVSPGLSRLTEWFLNGAELEPHFEILQMPPFQAGIEVISADSMARIHQEGRVAWAWADDASTQENRAFYEVLLSVGVDGIIAGRPGDVTAALTD